MAGESFKKFSEEVKNEEVRFIKKALDISEQVREILGMKEMSQQEFAALMEKKPSEVSRWLSGLHNLTLESIAKMEAVLNCDIIVTPKRACKEYPTYDKFKKVVFTSKKAAHKAAFFISRILSFFTPKLSFS